MAIRLLVDTCVWLDLAKDYREQPVINVLEDLVENGHIELVVPQQVVDEFDRNKARIIDEARRGLQPHFRLVRQAVSQFGDDGAKADLLAGLNEVDHQVGVNADAVGGFIERIDKLLHRAPVLATSDAVKQRVTERALAKQAPYHRAKNSVGDAILVEMYIDVASDATTDAPCAFITHNTKDFSDANGNFRKAHADLVHLFDAPKSSYWISMAEFLNDYCPDLLGDQNFDFNYSQEARRLPEILEAEHLLFLQVWYNRHWNLRHEIQTRKHHIVAEKDYSRSPYRTDQTLDTVWESALVAARRTEDEVGIENLGPWDDFEWGMINGKLSALRWILGDEWDMLDT
ncbi:PIN domain-containing protein [Robbsia sp. Bb-Pol-6]|uniref:PIN domain-containing protein n=1 Tax=Robbsia betulipollinis TaxID=2981849 RepID=A0ABT3ZMW3_9BURK|nr:PIN domain-containing protein [Robbsia betulipollinis]MCY0387893.1 PIN domain-containing protein [Robbsia betulipollinis]